MNQSSQITPMLIGRYIIVYVAWIVVGIWGFWLLFQIRNNLLDLLAYILEDPNTRRDTWISNGIERWYMVLMGAAWVFCITLLEGYFRISVANQQLFKRLARVTIILTTLTALSLTLQALFVLW